LLGPVGSVCVFCVMMEWVRVASLWVGCGRAVSGREGADSLSRPAKREREKMGS
jgi:uncharacterized membrane protein AbrB (regulator of aidB expression)